MSLARTDDLHVWHLSGLEILCTTIKGLPIDIDMQELIANKGNVVLVVVLSLVNLLDCGTMWIGNHHVYAPSHSPDN